MLLYDVYVLSVRHTEKNKAILYGVVVSITQDT